MPQPTSSSDASRSCGPLQLIDRKKLYAAVQPLLDRLGVDFTPDTPVAEMSLAQRQLLEIVKAISLDARLVIMDEPTSSLTITETDRLMRVIAGLKADDVSIIFISHRLNEVERCADRVVVLRDGRLVGELDRGEIAHGAMIRLMIGRDLKALYIPPAMPPGRERLEMIDVRTATYPDKSIDLAVRSGEILGARRPGRLRAHRARPRRLRYRPTAWRLASPGRRANRHFLATRGHRPRHLPGAGGSQTRGPAARRLGCRQHLAPRPAFLFPRPAWSIAASETANAERQKRRLNIRTPSVIDGRRHPLRWQSAEGRAGEMAVDESRASSSSTSRRAASTSAPRTRFTRCSAVLPIRASPS